MSVHIIFVATKKEALHRAKEGKENLLFEKVYKYSRGKGNNFYQFQEI